MLQFKEVLIMRGAIDQIALCNFFVLLDGRFEMTNKS